MSKNKDMDELLHKFVKEGPVGCACAVTKNNEILYENYFGYADLEKKTLVNQDTLFRLFSMTKPIICTAGMMLFERGKFLLSDPISEYFPEYKDIMVAVTDEDGTVHIEKAKNPMLVKHAFTMSVGIPYAIGDSVTVREMNKIKNELTLKYGKYDIVTEVKAMAKVPVEFEPGTHWLYGYGHDIVAGLIQLVSGKKVGEFLKDEIFTPLEMDNTAYRFCNNNQDRMASFYLRDESGNMMKSPAMMDEFFEPDAVYECGGAGLYSTLRDYVKFSQMLANGGVYRGEQIIGTKTIDLMRTNQLNEVQLKDFSNSYLAGYGYGLGVRTMMDMAAGNFNGSIGEFGWTGFAGTYTSIDPKDGSSIVYMHQMMPNMEEYHHHRVRAVANGILR